MWCHPESIQKCHCLQTRIGNLALSSAIYVTHVIYECLPVRYHTFSNIVIIIIRKVQIHLDRAATVTCTNLLDVCFQSCTQQGGILCSIVDSFTLPRPKIVIELMLSKPLGIRWHNTWGCDCILIISILPYQLSIGRNVQHHIILNSNAIVSRSNVSASRLQDFSLNPSVSNVPFYIWH